MSTNLGRSTGVVEKIEVEREFCKMNQKKRTRDSNSFVFKFLHAVWVIIESFSYPLVSILIESEHWNGIGSRKNLQICTLNELYYCFWAAWVWTSSSSPETNLVLNHQCRCTPQIWISQCCSRGLNFTGLSSQWYFILGFSAVVNAAMYVQLTLEQCFVWTCPFFPLERSVNVFQL